MALKSANPPAGKTRREEILDAAIELLISEGHGGLSVDKVARNLGISKGNITYHFRSKKDLVYEMFRRLKDDSMSMRPYGPENDKSPEESLTAALTMELDILSRPRYVTQLWETYAYGAHDRSVRQLIDELFEWYVERLSGYLTPVRPDLDESEIRDLAQSLIALTRGMMIFLAGFKDRRNERKRLTALTLQSALSLTRNWPSAATAERDSQR